MPTTLGEYIITVFRYHERQRSLFGFLIVLLALAPYYWIHRWLLCTDAFSQHINNDSNMIMDQDKLLPLLPQRSSLHTNQQHKHQRHYQHQNHFNISSNIHLVFSTGCSPTQNWQSYVFFYHALQVQQPGYVTRIASCPSPLQREEMIRRHEYEITNTMSDRFLIHTTPDYSFQMMTTTANQTEFLESYPYFNKPFGIRHWMKHVLGYPNPTVDSAITDDTIIVILDADTILFQPIRNDFSSWAPSSLSNVLRDKSHPRTRVEHGYPMAQEYYLDEWRKEIKNLTNLVGADSPILLHNFSQHDANYAYGAGPPYMLTARDLYAVVTLWCQLVPKVYPELLAEMYAYSIAAAHLQLKHQLANGFMLSTVTEPREAWSPSIDAISIQDACRPLSQTTKSNNNNTKPLLLHYCQQYSIGDFWFDKSLIHNDFLSCDAPMFDEPPLDAGARFNFYLNDEKDQVSFFEKTKNVTLNKTALSSEHLRVRQTFATCALFRSLNEAAIHYKNHHCGTSANYNKILRPE